jgi:hypothetical protein
MERTAPAPPRPARKSELFKFAVFPNYDESLNHLATHIAQPENWGFSNPAQEIEQGNMLAKYTFPVLRSYLENTFRKLQEEEKVLKTEDQHHACFNTGLVTPHFEDIYAFFARNRYPNQETPYYLIGFIRKSDHEFLRNFSMNPPRPANYFARPEELLFNPNLEIIPDVDHIISGNRARFPDAIAAKSDPEIRTTLVGAIAESAKRVRVNYKIAMPQYFRGAIQLLVPLYMTNRERPDLALVLEKINTRAYSARTCLTMGMAYNNARLIAKPQGTQWLSP